MLDSFFQNECTTWNEYKRLNHFKLHYENKEILKKLSYAHIIQLSSYSSSSKVDIKTETIHSFIYTVQVQSME